MHEQDICFRFDPFDIFDIEEWLQLQKIMFSALKNFKTLNISSTRDGIEVKVYKENKNDSNT